MKEWLNAKTYEYKQAACVTCGDEWIKIPEWANYAYNNDQGVCFLKSEIGYNHPLLIWQRPTQPEPLPFIDDEPRSLNYQYAEIEQVRQNKRSSSAWDVQVGGNHYKQFKIQPMQFALENKLDAAQQNVIKYIMRHSFKNGKQDLEKAKHYIDLMIEFYYGEDKTC